MSINGSQRGAVLFVCMHTCMCTADFISIRLLPHTGEHLASSKGFSELVAGEKRPSCPLTAQGHRQRSSHLPITAHLIPHCLCKYRVQALAGQGTACIRHSVSSCPTPANKTHSTWLLSNEESGKCVCLLGIPERLWGKAHLLAFRKLSDRKATWVSDVGSHRRPLVVVSGEIPEWDPCSFSHLALPRITFFRLLKLRWDFLLRAFLNISGHLEINKTWSLTFQMTLRKQTARLNIEHQIKYRTWKKRSHSGKAVPVGELDTVSFKQTETNKQEK